MARFEGAKLAAQGVTVGYGPAGPPVLKDLDVSVAPGDWLGIVGPNGSGKSTLLRTLAGLIRPRQGVVRLDGVDLRRWSRREVARRLAVVGAWPGEEFPFTVVEFVLLGRIPHQAAWGGESRDDWRAVERALELTRCSAFADRALPSLSDGERQRVALARALAQEPEVLLLDEPTAHLDLYRQVEIMTLLQRLREQTRLTLITVMHDLNLAALYCDRLVLLHEGRVHAAGSVWEVLQPVTIESVYGCRVHVQPHPTRQVPQILFP